VEDISSVLKRGTSIGLSFFQNQKQVQELQIRREKQGLVADKCRFFPTMLSPNRREAGHE
jgi:hypothetical protein